MQTLNGKNQVFASFANKKFKISNQFVLKRQRKTTDKR